VPKFYKNDGDIDVEARRRYIEKNEVLVVRWKYTSSYKTSLERINVTGRQINFEQEKIEYLADGECSAGLHLPGFVRRLDWRGDTTLGGSGIEEGRSHNRSPLQENRPPNMPTTVDLTPDDDTPQESKAVKNSKRNQSASADVHNNLASVAREWRRTTAIVNRYIYTYGDCCK
jgi:DNA (cytosine-5)-methyltransferase 1